MAVPLLIAAVAGYLLGSLPFGYLVARAHGVDIFKVGSGSSGATNVRRTLGAKAGNTVFVLDALKGMVAAGWPAWLTLAGADPVRCGVAGLISAILGHSFSCFTKFRGGKGVATAAGGLLVLMPLVVTISTVLWIVLFFALRYVSLASIVSAVALPVSSYFLHERRVLTALCVVIAVFVVIRHRANMGRLLKGTENRFDRKKSGPEGAK